MSWLHTDSVRRADELQYKSVIKNDSIQLSKLQNTNKNVKTVTKISIILNIILACLLLK